MTGLEWNANLPPPPPCFLPRPRYAYTAQVCAERVRVLSMNRPADKGNDYMGMFILNVIFIDESYQLGRPAWSRSATRRHVSFAVSFFRPVLQWILNQLEHTVCIPVRQHASPVRTHVLTHTQQSFHLASPLIYIFRGIFHHKRVLSSIFAGKLRLRIGASLSRTRNLLWKPGSSRRNPGNVLPTKWVPFLWKSCAELGM